MPCLVNGPPAAPHAHGHDDPWGAVELSQDRDLPRPGEHRNGHSVLRQRLDQQIAPWEAVTRAFFGALRRGLSKISTPKQAGIKGQFRCQYADAIDGTGPQILSSGAVRSGTYGFELPAQAAGINLWHVP